MKQGGQRAGGYTIVEVMIFLAISSLMFVMAAAFVSGKQDVVAFRQAMTDVGTSINGVIDQIANGQYPSNSNFSCTASKVATAPPVITTGATDQGANGGAVGLSGGCTFLGEVMQFNVGGVSSAFNTYTIAARQYDALGGPVSSFAAAVPIAVDSSAPGGVSLTQTQKLENGLGFSKGYSCAAGVACTSSSPRVYAIGFYGSFGNYAALNPSSGQSGAQSIITAVVPGASDAESRSAMVTTINNNVKNTTSVLSGGNQIVLCFTYGTRAGSVTIGGTNGQRFTTDVETGGGMQQVCKS